MGLFDRMTAFLRAPRLAEAREDAFLADLPLRRHEADVRQVAVASAARAREAIGLPFGMGGIDGDDYLYRRLTGGGRGAFRRDLTPLAQDQMIEIAYYLWEQNTLARRLVTLMSDLILGEGITVEAKDERNQVAIAKMWNHRINQMVTRVRQFYNALSVNGELILPVATNPIDGTPLLGFIDPYQVKRVETLPDNVLIPDYVVLKPTPGEQEGLRLKVVREDPVTGKLEGEVFFKPINVLPNSVRGRSDLMPLADWLDVYDTYMFGEVERLNLLSNFVWDWKITGADPKTIQEKLASFPQPKPGTIFAHNENEELNAVQPKLDATDRTEVAKMLRVHIAGGMGYPVSYLGDIDSNKATIEGQNDVMLKTPAARQQEFGSFINEIVRYSLEHQQGANPALFRDAEPGWVIRMPEISAKDVSRVGSVVAQVASGMDAALNNRTMSRRAATVIICAVVKHLGVELDPQTIMAEADEDAIKRQDEADELAADAARRNANNPNPPIPDDELEPAAAVA